MGGGSERHALRRKHRLRARRVEGRPGFEIRFGVPRFIAADPPGQPVEREQVAAREEDVTLEVRRPVRLVVGPDSAGDKRGGVLLAQRGTTAQTEGQESRQRGPSRMQRDRRGSPTAANLSRSDDHATSGRGILASFHPRGTPPRTRQYPATRLGRQAYPGPGRPPADSRLRPRLLSRAGRLSFAATGAV